MFRYALDPLSTEEPSADRQTISLIGLAQSQFSCNNWCRYSRTIAQLAHNNIPATQSNSELWTRRRAGDNYCTLLGVGDLVSQPYNWSIICWFRYRSLRFVALVLTTSDYEHINFYLHAKCSKQCLLSLYTTKCFYPDVTVPLPVRPYHEDSLQAIDRPLWSTLGDRLKICLWILYTISYYYNYYCLDYCLIGTGQCPLFTITAIKQAAYSMIVITTDLQLVWCTDFGMDKPTIL